LFPSGEVVATRFGGWLQPLFAQVVAGKFLFVRAFVGGFNGLGDHVTVDAAGL
jgi:hypothetical protein